jgi:hypothetical protein
MTRATRPTWRRWLGDAAPALSLVALLTLPSTLSGDAAATSAIRSRHAQIVAALSLVPYRVGPWIGEDIPVPEAAVTILKPNAVLARHYRDRQRGQAQSLLIVHCSDTRDMLGHYPPVCYPANGWVEAAEPSPCPLETAAGVIEARLYRFRRLRDWGSEERLRVADFFVLPDGRTTGDLADVERRAGAAAISMQGVAQIQLVSAGDESDAEFAAAAAEILRGAGPALRSVAAGSQP